MERNGSATPDAQLRIRIGLHVGDVVIQHQRPIGDVLNIAARIEPLAEPGGICVSEDVARQVHNKVNALFISMGKPDLKNIRVPLEIFRVSPTDSTTFPQYQEALFARNTKSIAVLPFANLSPDPENEYFSDGLTDDIITQLSRLSELKVISRTSVMQYKKTEKNAREIGRELGVTSILEGSVRRAGTRVRIAAQLIHAQTDAHQWAEIYDRELTDIFAIQSDVAQQIAKTLQATILPAEQKQLERTPTQNVEAYHFYLHGRYFFEKRTAESLEKALEFFERAIAQDSRYALAYSGVADSYDLLANYGIMPSKEAFAKAQTAAHRALQLDESLAEAHASLAVIKSDYEWDWVGAEREFKRAIELNPGYARAHQWYAVHLAMLGRHADAQREIERAQELDPLSLTIIVNRGVCSFLKRDYEDSIQALNKTLELDKNFAPARTYLSWAYAQRKMYDEAVAQTLASLSLGGEKTEFLHRLAEAYQSLGWSGFLRKRIELMNCKEESRIERPVIVAGIYAQLGEIDLAFEWLERAYECRDSTLCYIKTHAAFDVLRSDMRFAALLKKIGFAQ
jgi:TolB-like protein/Tfp pilus assembly protein PilF